MPNSRLTLQKEHKPGIKQLWLPPVMFCMSTWTKMKALTSLPDKFIPFLLNISNDVASFM